MNKHLQKIIIFILTQNDDSTIQRLVLLDDDDIDFVSTSSRLLRCLFRSSELGSWRASTRALNHISMIPLVGIQRCSPRPDQNIVAP
jgi:hypothetical protein